MNEKDNYLNLQGLSKFFNKLNLLFATKNEIKDIKGDIATTTSNGLMSKDMVTRLNICTSELVQTSEPTTQKSGDSWLQEYT